MRSRVVSLIWTSSVILPVALLLDLLLFALAERNEDETRLCCLSPVSRLSLQDTQAGA